LKLASDFARAGARVSDDREDELIRGVAKNYLLG
jgi:hypothetical protein